MLSRTFGVLGVVALLAGCGGGGDGQRGAALPGDPCENTIDCTPGSICYSQVCVGEGPVRFSMSWRAETDIDLHVLTPENNEIYFGAREFDNGTLDVDDCVAGACDEPGTVHVENVFFVDTEENAVVRGTYTFWAVNYDEEVDTEVTIEGFLSGSPVSYTETVPLAAPSEGVRHTLVY